MKKLIKRFWQIVSKPSGHLSFGFLTIGGFIAGIIFWGGFNTTLEATNTEAFCIGCHEMSLVKVVDAARCRMGDIDQWNEEEGQCLSHIYVEPSELINISK